MFFYMKFKLNFWRGVPPTSYKIDFLTNDKCCSRYTGSEPQVDLKIHFCIVLGPKLVKMTYLDQTRPCLEILYMSLLPPFMSTMFKKILFVLVHKCICIETSVYLFPLFAIVLICNPPPPSKKKQEKTKWHFLLRCDDLEIRGSRTP